MARTEEEWLEYYSNPNAPGRITDEDPNAPPEEQQKRTFRQRVVQDVLFPHHKIGEAVRDVGRWIDASDRRIEGIPELASTPAGNIKLDDEGNLVPEPERSQGQKILESVVFPHRKMWEATPLAGKDRKLKDRLASANFDDKARLDIIQSALKSKVDSAFDDHGNIVVNFNEEQAQKMGIDPGHYYLNSPGPSGQDLSDFAYAGAVELPFIYGGLRLFRAPAHLVGHKVAQFLGAGTGAAAGSIAGDLGAIDEGSRQGIDGVKATIAFATGGASEVGGTLLASWIKHARAVGRITKDGQLTPTGIKHLEDMGVDPENITPELQIEFQRLVKDAAEPEHALVAAEGKTLDYEVPLSRGDVTRNPEVQRIEAMAQQGGFGPETQAKAQQFRDSQQTQLRRNVEALRRRVSGDSPTGVPSRNVGDELFLDELRPDAAGFRGALQRKVDDSKNAYSALYDEAGALGASIPVANMKQAAVNMGKRIDDQFGSNAPKEARNLVREFEEMLQDPSGYVNIQVAEQWLVRVNTAIRTAGRDGTGPRQKYALGLLKDEYEKFMDAATAKGWVRGSGKAIKKYRQARNLRRHHAEMFDNDPILRDFMERSQFGGDLHYVLEDATAIDAFFSGQGMKLKKGAGNSIRRLRSVLSKDEWALFKEQIFIRLLMSQNKGARGQSGQLLFSGDRFSSALRDLQKNGAVYNEIFTAEERRVLEQFRRTAFRATNRDVARDAVNPSGSGYVGVTNANRMAAWAQTHFGEFGAMLASALRKYEQVVQQSAKAAKAQRFYDEPVPTSREWIVNPDGSVSAVHAAGDDMSKLAGAVYSGVAGATAGQATSAKADKDERKRKARATN